jgi:hypothetical protein
MIVVGTGSPSYCGDVLFEGDRITGVGTVAAPLGEKRIDRFSVREFLAPIEAARRTVLAA